MSRDNGASHSGRRWGLLLFGILICCYTFIHQLPGWNQTSRLDLLHALFTQRTFAIDAYHENTGDKSLHDGHYYSDKAPGIVLLAIPAFAVAIAILSGLGIGLDSQSGWIISSWITTAGSVGIITALGGVTLFILLQRFVERRYAFNTTFVIFLGAAPFPYATMLFSHAAIIGLLSIALWATQSQLNHNLHESQRPSNRRLILAGMCCGLAIASEYTAAPTALGIFLLVAMANPRRAGIMAAAAAIPLLVIPGYNWICFDGPFSFGYHHLALREFHGMHQGLFGITLPPKASATYLITCSPKRGLFFWTPFFALAFIGLRTLKAMSSSTFWITISVCLAQVICISGYYMPDGGGALGPRHLAPMIVFLAIPTAIGFQRAPNLGWLLGLYSLILTGFGTAIDAMPPTEVANPLLDYYPGKLSDGHFAHCITAVIGIPAPVIAMCIVGIYCLFSYRIGLAPKRWVNS